MAIIQSQQMVKYGNYYYHYTFSPPRIVSGGGLVRTTSTEKNERTEEQKNLSFKISAHRAKKTLTDLILCNLPYGSPKFLTLTYKNPCFDDKEAKKHFKQFIQRLKYHTKISLRYIAVPEEHNSYSTRPDRLHSYHFHILIFDMPYLSAKVYSDIWRHGFIKINRINDNHMRVGFYIAKYLTKSRHVPYSRRFLASRNCFRSVTLQLTEVPPLVYLHSRNYNRFTGGLARCDIYTTFIPTT